MKKYKIKSILTLILFLILLLLSSVNIFGQEEEKTENNESIYQYLSPEEAFFLISYSNLEELKKIADSLKLEYPEDITLDELRALLFKYYNFTEIKKNKSQDTLFIKSTDIIRISEDNRVIDLIGNNIIVYKGYLFKADRIIFYIDEETIYGYGNVSFKSNSMQAIAESFEYSIPKKNGAFYKATLYIDKYIISTNEAKISDNNTLITEDATVTQCDLSDPHYYLIVNRVLYKEDIIYFYNIQLVIGSEKLFYIPLYISYEKGYRYPLLFGMDYGYREGFMFFNTIKRENYEIYIDIYERLGLYIGFKNQFEWKKNGLSILAGFSISPDLFYDDSSNIWTIVPPYTNFSLFNINFRTAITGQLKLRLLDDFITNIKFSYFTDPYFYYDYFERERFLRFDITQFTSFDWQNDYNLFPSTKLSFNEEIQTSIKIWKLTMSLSSSFNFTATKSDLLEPSIISYYLYSPKYYQYYLSSIKWISASLSGSIINISESWVNFNLSGSTNTTYNTYYNDDNEIQKKSFAVSSSLNPSFSLKSNLFSFSFSMNNNLSYSDIVTDQSTESLIYYSTISNSFSLNMPILRISLNLSESYRNSIFEPIDFGWLSNKAIATLIFNPFSFISISASVNYNFLDSTDKELWEISIDNFDIILINSSLRFKYLSFLYNGKFYINVQKLLINQFSLNFSIPKTKILFFWLTISDTMNLKLDIINPFSQYFENIFSINFLIDKELEISFRVSSYNQFIYRYDSLSEAIVDLINSFNFFDYYARLNSYFDLRSLSLNIFRYLHDMTLQFQIAGNFILSSDQTKYNFVISYSIYIISNFLTGYKYNDQWENVF